MASADTLVTFGPAEDQQPASDYASLFVRNGHWLLAFDDTVQQAAIFCGIMPRNYAGGNITVYLTWLAVAVTGTVGWLIEFENDKAGGHDLDSDAWATPQTVTATAVDGTSGIGVKTSVTITAGAGGTDSVAAGDPFRIRVSRDVGSDTAVGNAQLLAVELKEA